MKIANIYESAGTVVTTPDGSAMHFDKNFWHITKTTTGDLTPFRNYWKVDSVLRINVMAPNFTSFKGFPTEYEDPVIQIADSCVEFTNMDSIPQVVWSLTSKAPLWSLQNFPKALQIAVIGGNNTINDLTGLDGAHINGTLYLDVPHLTRLAGGSNCALHTLKIYSAPQLNTFAGIDRTFTQLHVLEIDDCGMMDSGFDVLHLLKISPLHTVIIEKNAKLSNIVTRYLAARNPAPYSTRLLDCQGALIDAGFSGKTVEL